MGKCTVIQGGAAYDDRGALKYFNDLDLSSLGVKRMYMVENNDACSTRAWHGHQHEAKLVLILRGSAVIAAVPMTAECTDFIHSELERFVVTANQPKIIRIPPGMANGVRTLEAGTQVMVMSTSSLEDSKNDDFRFPLLDSFNPFKVEVR